MTLTFWNTFDAHNYMWVKRYDNQWSWVTAVINENTKTAHFYLNGTEVDSKGGFGSPSPLEWEGKLKSYGSNSAYLGMTPSLEEGNPVKYFKGDIAKVFAWKRALNANEVAAIHLNLPKGDLVLNLDADYTRTTVECYGVEEKEETFTIPNSIIPYRVEGKFRCLPHPDEGIVNGRFVKGETTAANEKRYVLQMQQGEVNYKEDGIQQVQYTLVEEKQLTPWAKMLNITL
jgi:hypothetical protein